MSETPYTETEFLLRVLNDDQEGAKKLMAEMSDRELAELRKAFREGKHWVEDEQSIRYAIARDNKPVADGKPAEASP